MSVFGAQASASQPSLFGTPQSAPSLFGSQPTSASLFSAPSSAPSLFGAPASSASAFGVSVSSSSLFGAPASSASLFGAPASSASLFGTPASSSSLFGAPASSASPFGGVAQSTSLFGAIQQQGQFQQQQQQQQQQRQQQQQQQQQQQHITSRTRISELPQNFQTDLFAVERHLREQRNKASLLSSKRSNVDQNVSQTKTRALSISKRLVKVNADLESLQTNANALKLAVKTERGSAEPVVIALENLTKESRSGFIDSNGLRYGIAGSGMPRAAHVPEEYFTRVLQEMEARVHEYKVEIDEIAEFLKSQGIVLGSTFSSFIKSEPGGIGGAAGRLGSISVLHDGMDISEPDKGAEMKGKTIEEVIRRQYDYFMIVASHVATLNETLRSTKEWFLRIMRARNPDGPDPFSQASLREKAAKDRQVLLAERGLLGATVGLQNTEMMAASSQPLTQPSFQPLTQPSSQPLTQPSSQPLTQPSSQPLTQPSSQPSLFQSHSGAAGLFATTGSGFGSTGFLSSANSSLDASAFGGDGVFGGTLNTSDDIFATNATKRMSAGRRKRS